MSSSQHSEASCNAGAQGWSYHDPSKCQELLAQWHSITTQKTLGTTTVRTSSVALFSNYIILQLCDLGKAHLLVSLETTGSWRWQQWPRCRIRVWSILHQCGRDWWTGWPRWSEHTSTFTVTLGVSWPWWLKRHVTWRGWRWFQRWE